MTMKHIHLITFIFLLFTSFTKVTLAASNIQNPKPSQAQPSSETITLVSDYYCPFNCKDGEDKKGILIDIVKEAFSPHGIKVEYKNIPWSRAISDTRAGKYTAIIGAARSEAPDFIFPAIPQVTAHFVFYTLKDNNWYYDYHEKDSLNDLSFGAVIDYSYNKEIDAYIAKNKKNPSKVQLAYGEDAMSMNMNKLLSGRIDAILEENMVIRNYITEHHLEDKLRPAGVLMEDQSSFLFIAFSPKNPESRKYARILDQETLNMIYSGRMAEIMNEYRIKNSDR